MRAVMLLAAVVLAGCASVAMEPADPRRAVVLAPVNQAAGFGALRIRESEVFYPAKVDGAPAWCSSVATFFTPGEARISCLLDPAGDRPEGWFKAAYVAGTVSTMRQAVDVPYRVVARPALPPR